LGQGNGGLCLVFESPLQLRRDECQCLQRAQP
jgi:hypothetical protein